MDPFDEFRPDPAFDAEVAAMYARRRQGDRDAQEWYRIAGKHAASPEELAAVQRDLAGMYEALGRQFQADTARIQAQFGRRIPSIDY
jgi:hypothetical protein